MCRPIDGKRFFQTDGARDPSAGRPTIRSPRTPLPPPTTTLPETLTLSCPIRPHPAQRATTTTLPSRFLILDNTGRDKSSVHTHDGTQEG